jgi:hypothetical protein
MTTTTDRKRCALECGGVEELEKAKRGTDEGVLTPCVLLDPHAYVLQISRATQLEVGQQSEVEDESADPVGDGISDAEFAARLAD